MKNIINFSLCFIISILFLSSCLIEDFLEKAPGVDVTEETIFSSKVMIETAITGLYASGINDGFPRNRGFGNTTPEGNRNLLDACTDMAEMGDSWYQAQMWNVGDINPQNIIAREDFRFHERWRAIRRANVILEWMNKPSILNLPEVTPDYRDQVKGEAMFIRALNYFEMIIRYGGMPIVNERLVFMNDIEELKLPRNSLKEVVDFIIQDLDSAYMLVPATYPGNFRGRITKAATLALKSRTLLTAASPQFNTSTPYIDFGPNNALICMGNTDLERWRLAAETSKKLIDEASEGGFSLIEGISNPNTGANESYFHIWERNDNAEIILAAKTAGPDGIWTWPSVAMAPGQTYWSWGGVSIPFNFQSLYEKNDGTPMDWGTSGDDVEAIYAQLDPRFRQTIAHQGYNHNGDYQNMDMSSPPLSTGNVGSAWLIKYTPRQQNWNNSMVVRNWINFRLAEAYLNYAEALNEFHGGPTPEAYSAINRIRNRSGMPNLPTGLSQAEFRRRVHNERAIELAYEGHRLFDLRRWLRAEENGTMRGEFKGLRLRRNGDRFSYEVFTFEERTFPRALYLHPLPQNEVFKGYLIQNPGW